MTRNVLILGCGRSGTSIFGELFESLPGFDYFDEPHLDEIVAPAGRAMAVKVPVLHTGESAPIGCAASWPTLATAMPEPRVVYWQVRHPLDTVCSLRVGIGAGWRHHPRPPDWEAWLAHPLVEQSAHHWVTINSFGFEQVRAFAVVNSFEAMLADPFGCAERAARAVDLDPDDAEVRAALTTWPARVQDADNEAFIEARRSRNHSRPDHDRRVERWRDNLTPAEARAAATIVAPAAAQFGYSLPPDA